MSSTKQIVEQTRDVAEALARAMGISFGREVTAYLTDAYLVAGCCVGVVHRHVRADVYGRFQNGTGCAPPTSWKPISSMGFGRCIPPRGACTSL